MKIRMIRATNSNSNIRSLDYCYELEVLDDSEQPMHTVFVTVAESQRIGFKGAQDKRVLDFDFIYEADGFGKVVSLKTPQQIAYEADKKARLAEAMAAKMAAKAEKEAKIAAEAKALADKEEAFRKMVAANPQNSVPLSYAERLRIILRK
jgi:hypothetical protein